MVTRDEKIMEAVRDDAAWETIHATAHPNDSWSRYVDVIHVASGEAVQIRCPRRPLTTTYSLWVWSDIRGAYAVGWYDTITEAVFNARLRIAEQRG